jgi:hypothetical protein
MYNNRQQYNPLREASTQIVFETELKTKKVKTDDAEVDFDTMSFEEPVDDNDEDSIASDPSSFSCESEDSVESEAIIWKSVLNYYATTVTPSDEKVHEVC